MLLGLNEQDRPEKEFTSFLKTESLKLIKKYFTKIFQFVTVK